jgi:hypothetical protein
MATQSFKRILELFEAHGVEYIVVGGVAAVLRGAPVTTFDIDTLVKTDQANAQRLLAALQALNARYREHPNKLKPTVEDILAGGHHLLMTDSGPLDVLGHVMHGKRYDDMTQKSSMLSVGELTIPVLGLRALMDEKQALGRPKDKAIAEMLAELLAREPPDDS